MQVMRKRNSYTIALAVLLIIFAIIFTIGCGGNTPAGTTPTVMAAAPPTGADGACANAIITATFSKAMSAASIDATTFTLTAPGTIAVMGQVTYNATSNTATFTPTSALVLSTLYTATITTGATDSAGIALASDFVWTFTTGSTSCQAGPPTVISEVPASAATGVCPNTILLASFSAAMNPTTISMTTFTLTSPGPTSVTGQVGYDAPSHVATFTPATNLALNTIYTATITTAAQDLFGNALTSNFVWSFTTVAVACQGFAGPPLGSAANFEILAGTTVTSTGETVITGGDLGLSPGSAVTGFPPGILTFPAVMFITDPTAAQAQLDLTTAYLYTAGLPGGAVLPGDLSGLTFAPGLYTTASTVMLSSGNVTLDGGGDPNAVFIFQIASTLTTIGSTQVVLSGGTQAKNVFWQTGSSATLGTNSIFEGTILALKSIALDTGATLNGRALARNAAVTLEGNAVNAP
jgi:hypothetical protein